MGFLGDAIDNVGTALNLPEIGLSELFNGGSKTSNTGRVAYNPGAALAVDAWQPGAIPYTIGGAGAFANATRPGQAPSAVQVAQQGVSGASQGGSVAQQGGANTGAYGGGGGGSTPTYDPATAAYYQSMIDNLNGQNGRLDGQLNTGLGNITNSYNLQSNRLNDQKSVAQRNYDTQTQQNMQNYSNTRNGIMSNTRAQANALQRLLGLNGAGNSSAALEQAPYAAGLQGSQNLNQAQQSYSNNMTGLNNNWEDTQRQYSNAFQDLNNQKYQQENSLRSSINQTRANLLDKIAQAGVQKNMAMGQGYQQAQAARAPYEQQINSLLDSIAGLGSQYANPVMKTADVNFTNPQLAQFSLGNQAQIANQSGGAGNLDPSFVNLLTPKKDDRNSNPLTQGQ